MTVQSLVQEDPLEEERQLAPVLFPGKFHGRRSLAVYSPWGCKVWDRTGRAGTPAHHHTMHPVIIIICSLSSSASVWILSTLFTAVTKGLAHSSVTQSCLTLRPHGLQHTRFPSPSPSSRDLLRLMSIESMMPSNLLTLSSFLPSIFPSIREFAFSSQNIGASASGSLLSMNI